MPTSQFLALLIRSRVDFVELGLVDLPALDQVGFTRVVDLDLLQHLPNDDLDVLIVYRHPLQPIDILNLVHEIGGELFDAFDSENVMRRGVALNDRVPLLDEVAVLQMDVLALGDQILLRLFPFLRWLDDDAALVLVVAPETDGAGDLGDDGRLLRPSRLEQLRHAGQATGDVARLGTLGRDASHNVSRLHMGSWIDRDDGVDRELIARLARSEERRVGKECRSRWEAEH